MCYPHSITCKKCGETKEIYRNGIINLAQKYKCLSCGHKFSRIDGRLKFAREMKKIAAFFAQDELKLEFDDMLLLFGVKEKTMNRWLDLITHEFNESPEYKNEMKKTRHLNDYYFTLKKILNKPGDYYDYAERKKEKIRKILTTGNNRKDEKQCLYQEEFLKNINESLKKGAKHAQYMQEKLKKADEELEKKLEEEVRRELQLNQKIEKIEEKQKIKQEKHYRQHEKSKGKKKMMKILRSIDRNMEKNIDKFLDMKTQGKSTFEREQIKDSLLGRERSLEELSLSQYSLSQNSIVTMT
jgi:transposase-like protein